MVKTDNQLFKLLGGSIILGILLVGIGIYVLQKYRQINQSSPITPDIPVVEILSPWDKEIIKYLLSQKDFSWKTASNSTNFCVFERLDKSEAIFPQSIWVRCGEFVLENNNVKELSGVSLPILINYPNELSVIDISKFTHQKPRDGELFSKDINTIFSTLVAEKIFNFEATTLSNKLIRLARQELNKNVSITVTGTIICLSHKSTSGPQTMECAFGIKDNNGEEHGLSDLEMKYIRNLPTGKKVTVSGIYRPTENSNYKAKGSIEIESIETND